MFRQPRNRLQVARRSLRVSLIAGGAIIFFAACAHPRLRAGLTASVSDDATMFGIAVDTLVKSWGDSLSVSPWPLGRETDEFDPTTARPDSAWTKVAGERRLALRGRPTRIVDDVAASGCPLGFLSAEIQAGCPDRKQTLVAIGPPRPLGGEIPHPNATSVSSPRHRAMRVIVTFAGPHGASRMSYDFFFEETSTGWRYLEGRLLISQP